MFQPKNKNIENQQKNSNSEIQIKENPIKTQSNPKAI